MIEPRLQAGDTAAATSRPVRQNGDAQKNELRASRPDSSPVRRRLFSVQEAGDYLSLSPWTIREMVWRGELPEVRMGRRLLIDKQDLDALIDRTKRNRERI